MLTVQCQRIAGVGGKAGRTALHRLVGGGPGHGGGLGAGQQEGGVGGEHHVDQRAAPARGKAVKVGVLRCQRANPVKVARGVQWGDQPGQPVGAGSQPFAFQFGHHRFKLGEIQLAAFDPPRQFQPQLEHRVEQRRIARLLVQFLKSGVEFGDFAHARLLRAGRAGANTPGHTAP